MKNCWIPWFARWSWGLTLLQHFTTKYPFPIPTGARHCLLGVEFLLATCRPLSPLLHINVKAAFHPQWQFGIKIERDFKLFFRDDLSWFDHSSCVTLKLQDDPRRSRKVGWSAACRQGRSCHFWSLQTNFERSLDLQHTHTHTPHNCHEQLS